MLRPSSKGDQGKSRVEAGQEAGAWGPDEQRPGDRGVRSVRHGETAVGLGDWLGAGSKETPSRLQVRVGFRVSHGTPEPGTDEEAQERERARAERITSEAWVLFQFRGGEQSRDRGQSRCLQGAL